MISVTVISDFACPFCYVAKQSLKKAAEGLDVSFRWLPFELTPPDQPPVDTVGDPVRREHYAQALEPVCRELGISIHLPPRIRPRPYTRLAMEGQLFAERYGKAEEYSDRVFDAYYVEEQDIGSPAVLTALAAEAGLPAEEFSAALQNGTYTQELLERERFAMQTYRPETVPLIVINDTVRLDGDIYSVEQYRDALVQKE